MIIEVQPLSSVPVSSEYGAGPLLIVHELQRRYIARDLPTYLGSEAASVLFCCRRLLESARRHRWQIAHVMRHDDDLPAMTEAQAFRPISGFEAAGSEMVFTTHRPSAFSSQIFESMMLDHGACNAALIGFGGSSGCLETLNDAWQRGHRVSLISDASLSPRGCGIRNHGIDRRAMQIAQRAGVISTTEEFLIEQGLGSEFTVIERDLA